MNLNALQIVDLLAATVTVVSLVLAIIAMAKSERSARELSDAMSTRYHDAFPAYLPQVAEAIRGSRTKLKIMGVVPSHGSYTDPAAWRDIQYAIQQKVDERLAVARDRGETFDARILYCDEENLRKTYYDQYSTLQDRREWENYKRSDRGLLEPFLQREGVTIDIDQLSLDEFIEIRVRHDGRVVHDTYRGFQCLRGGEVYPFFCWITDTAAVFSLKMEDGHGKYSGRGFSTRDMSLVATLEKSFDYYWQRSLNKADAAAG